MAEAPMESYPSKKHRVCKSREEIDVKMEEIDAKKDDRNLTTFTGRVISFIERLGDGYGWIDRISDCRFDGAHFIQEHIKCDDPDYMGVVKSGQSVEYVLDESTFTVVMVTLPGGVSAPASETNRRNTLPTPSEPTEQNSDGDYLPEEVWNLERLGKDGLLLMDSEKQNVKEDKHAYFFGGGLARRNASKENNYADDEKHKGTVTWFSEEEEGYGVLRPESGKYEHQYFLQFFIKCDDPKYMGVLHVGQSVEYVLDEPTNIVLMVTLPGGLPAPASKTALRNPPCDYGYSTFVDDLDDTADMKPDEDKSMGRF